MNEPKKIIIPVDGGCVRLQFSPGWSTGPDEDTNPGIGFEYIADCLPHQIGEGLWRGGMGVFSRTNAAALRDMLIEFLDSNPPPEPSP